VTRAEALASFTTGAAFAGFDEARTGMLRPGRYADLAVLDADPLASPPDSIGSIGVSATLTGGRVAYSADQRLPEGMGP
jgi:predicted amidohydrolase YtcJ